MRPWAYMSTFVVLMQRRVWLTLKVLVNLFDIQTQLLNALRLKILPVSYCGR